MTVAENNKMLHIDGRWWEPGFSLLEWEETEEARGEAKISKGRRLE